MANMDVTTIDIFSVALDQAEHRDDLLTFAGAATYLSGTILARDSVSQKLVPYVIGGATNQNGIPKAVLTYPVSRATAGDVPVRALVAGTVNRNRLIVAADGTSANLTKAILDLLRAFGIVPIDVQQLDALDNQ